MRLSIGTFIRNTEWEEINNGKEGAGAGKMIGKKV